MSNFNTQIIPLFEKLKEIVKRNISAMPEDSPMKALLEKKISQLKLKAENWGKDEGRCGRKARPFAASIQDITIRICPWMTHLDHRSLLTLLAHELGHFMDPCKQWSIHPKLKLPLDGIPYQHINQCLRKDNSPKKGDINPYDINSDSFVGESSCQGFRHEELFCDYTGAHMASEFLADHPQFFEGYSQNQIASSLLYYRLNGCDIKPNDPSLGLFQVEGMQKALSCDTLNDSQMICSNEVINQSISNTEDGERNKDQVVE